MTADKKLKEQRDILLRCLNRIGDVFEYQYKRMTPEQLKEMVLNNFNIMNKELVLLEQQEQD